MRLKFKIVLTFVLCLSGASVTQAQSWLDQPTLHGRQSASVGVATVPLPPGQWTQVEQDVKPHPGEYDVVVQRAGFMQVDAGRVVALAIIEANAKPADSGINRGERYGMRPSSACTRQDVYLSEGADAEMANFDCLLVNHIMISRSATDQPMRDIHHAAAAYGGIPSPMIYTEFNMTGQYHRAAVFVRIYVDPGRAGFPAESVPWADSAWQKDDLTAPRRAYLDKVVAWSRAYRVALKVAMNP